MRPESRNCSQTKEMTYSVFSFVASGANNCGTLLREWRKVCRSTVATGMVGAKSAFLSQAKENNARKIPFLVISDFRFLRW